MDDKNLNQALIAHFGSHGDMYYKEAQNVYKELLYLTKNESKGRQENLKTSLLPFVAVYKVLLSKGMSKEEALDHMYQTSEIYTRHGMRKTYEKASKLPFFFWLFRKMFSIGLKGDSWEVEWVSNNSETFEYNIKKCLWHDVCTELGYPELCKIFCKNDEINFTNVSPHLHFYREKTLGNGDDCCDFHFYKHEKKGS